jgi:hypothetical protein
MIAPQGMQTARFYVDTDVDTRPDIIKRLTKPRNYNSSMDTQLSIEDKVMLNGHSSSYDFTNYNHFEIVDMFEKCRKKHNLNVKEFSEMAKYSRCCYIQKVKNQHRFSYASFNRFKDICNYLDNNKNQKPVYEVSQPLPVYKPTSNNVEWVGQLTEQMCINFLKATGKYKISKSEITTNWIEL